MPGRRHKKNAPSVTELERLVIEDLGARGDGIGRAGGTAIHVPFTAPGDVISAAWRDGRWQATAFHEQSDMRRAPPCRFCGTCGGCALQHITPEAYQQFKFDRLVGLAENAGLDSEIIQPMISCPIASRRRALFALRRRGGKNIFGFHERASRAIVDIDECMVLAPQLSSAMPRLRDLGDVLLKFFPAVNMQVTVCETGLDLHLTGDVHADDLTYDARESIADAARVAGAARISLHSELIAMFSEPIIRFGELAVVLPPGGFLQASLEGEAILTRLVLEACEGAKFCADLFCGCGTFSAPLSVRATVLAIDAEMPAIEALRNACAAQNRGDRIKVEKRNLFRDPLVVQELSSFEVVVFDPPRAGAEAQANALSTSDVPTIVGVSCNPVTFLRDALILQAGGYRLETLTPIDQFIYSPHLEMVGVFKR